MDTLKLMAYLQVDSTAKIYLSEPLSWSPLRENTYLRQLPSHEMIVASVSPLDPGPQIKNNVTSYTKAFVKVQKSYYSNLTMKTALRARPVNYFLCLVAVLWYFFLQFQFDEICICFLKSWNKYVAVYVSNLNPDIICHYQPYSFLAKVLFICSRGSISHVIEGDRTNITNYYRIHPFLEKWIAARFKKKKKILTE